MSLQEEIALRANQIFRESYQMSIGELINLYKDEEWISIRNFNEFSDGQSSRKLG